MASDWQWTVYRRKKSSVWQMRVWNGDQTIRKTTKKKEKAKAEEFAQAFVSKLGRITGGDTLGDVWDACVAYRKAEGIRFSPATEEGYRHTRKKLGHLLLMPVWEITKRDIVKLHDALVERGDAPLTIKQTKDRLKRVYKWAVDRERAPEFPGWPGFDIVKKTHKRSLERFELAKVIAFIYEYQNGRWVLFFDLMFSTGARAGEILGLRGENIVRQSNKIRLRPTSHKTRGDWKTINIAPELMKRIPDVGRDELLFDKIRPAYRNGQPQDVSVVRKILKKALRANNIPEGDVDLHSLRRSWAALAKQLGINMQTAMSVLGHKSKDVHQAYAGSDGGQSESAAVSRIYRLIKGDVAGLLTPNQAEECATDCASVPQFANPNASLLNVLSRGLESC